MTSNSKLSGLAVQFLGSIFLIGMFCAASPAQTPAPNPSPRIEQEDDIRLAAFVFVLNLGTGPDPDYAIACLSIDSSWLDSLHDPPDSLIKRFPKMHKTLRKASECEISKKNKAFDSAVKDKQTGKPASLISLSRIYWLSEDEVGIDALRYCGQLCMWGGSLIAKRADGKWTVSIDPKAPSFVS